MGYKKWHPKSIPTREDLLDINFDSIVSDLRCAIRGTLVTRSLSEFSQTWSGETPQKKRKVINKQMHASDKAKHNMRVAQMIRHTTEILLANGLSRKEAKAKALELLNQKETK